MRATRIPHKVSTERDIDPRPISSLAKALGKRLLPERG